MSDGDVGEEGGEAPVKGMEEKPDASPGAPPTPKPIAPAEDRGEISSASTMSLIFSVVILAMTTVPAIYISVLALAFTQKKPIEYSPTPLTEFFFTFASIKSDIFNLFNMVALPTLTAYFGTTSNDRGAGWISWSIFLYFLFVFAISYMPDVASVMTIWNQVLTPNKIDPGTISQYVQTVRNGAIAAIAVVAGIKLAKGGEVGK